MKDQKKVKKNRNDELKALEKKKVEEKQKMEKIGKHNKFL